ncbi:hypothetical protein AK830_g9851 [Neonectria ditissima]|uniref:Zn(2)-C6 fungal-type domain-containing protein n=1 Tax=Neonectria ditissima TaxID=78410 RepID=A0A0P7B8E1_9HYPO|nr:hypothetical protein AK830_g9851 [Neonectria ditissima]
MEFSWTLDTATMLGICTTWTRSNLLKNDGVANVPKGKGPGLAASVVAHAGGSVSRAYEKLSTAVTKLPISIGQLTSDAGDEKRPTCGLCTSANVECQYKTRLTFLEKNAQTLTRGVVQDTAPKGATYSNVKFVTEEHGSSTKLSERSLSPSRVTENKVHHSRKEAIKSQACLEDTNIVQRHPGMEEIDQSGSQRSEQDAEIFDEAVSASLVSLDPSDSDRVTPLSDLRSSTNSIMKIAAKPPAGNIPLTSNGIALLKHYIYHVAPWTFGLLIPRLAMTSPLVLDVVLKLAAVSSGSNAEDVKKYGIGSSNLFAASLRPETLSAPTVLHHLVAFIFLKTQLFAGSGPEKWEPTFVSGGPVPSFMGFDFGDLSHRRIWVATVTLMSRLEIAYSLIHEMAPAVGSAVLYEMLDSPENTDAEEQGFQASLRDSLRCLVLLIDVMGLCLQPADQDTSSFPVRTGPRMSKVDRWKQLYNDLRAWHVDRCPDLQELAELDENGTLFPTVLFTSRVGAATSILYHVTMFLLLRHRPRSIRLYEEYPQIEAMEAQVSPQWHARRVCGIALSSDSQHTECWDPCTIAAFALAARGMTHHDQQIELLSCLQRVKTSGWRVEGLVRNLRDEWGLYGA